MPRKRTILKKNVSKYRKKTTIPKLMSSSTKFFKVKSIYSFGIGGASIISSTPAAVAGTPIFNTGSYNFQLSGIDLVSTYSALFDQYRIVAVDIRFRPQFNIDQAAAVNSNLGEFMTVIDYDDSTALSSWSAGRAYENNKVTNTMTEHHRMFKPHVAVAAYQGALTAFANFTSPWIDVAYPNTQHYGVKWAFSGGYNTTVLASYSVDAYLMVEFKSIR